VFSSEPSTSAASAACGVEIVSGLAALAARYDLIFCDVWGVLHDGITAFPEAGEALRRFRAGGGRVVLVSNAPRPGFVVGRQLDSLGLPREAYDAIVTSGDVTRAIVAERGDETIYHLGPERDVRLFEGLPAKFGSADEADYVVCTGLFDDETETVGDYAPTLARLRERDLWFLCANPDVVVERGHLLIPCAGALAAAYEAIGGRTHTGGKPHRPIYETAYAAGTKALGQPASRARILAVGDAIRTDVAGARAFGVDALMVGRGIHAGELGIVDGRLDVSRAIPWLQAQGAVPTSLTTALVWD
jgi:HAD superfamily hydrolase (TIGR01459 family)